MNSKKFRSGSGKTAQIGHVNDNNQKVLGTRGVEGNDYNQYSYKMECLDCGHIYGANGSDIHLRKCPRHQDGALGIDY